MVLNLQIVSDLHVEFLSDKMKFNLFKPVAPILILAGDICCIPAEDDFIVFKRLITELVPKYEYIIMVSGNHEYFYNQSKRNIPPNDNHTMAAVDKKIKAFFKETSPKLHYLNNNNLKITVGKTKYLIIGSTLWSYIPKPQQSQVQETMNDYRYIYTGADARNIIAKDVMTMFNKNYRYIKSQIAKAESKTKIIVITHHQPYLNKNYNVESNDPAYMSDCSELIKHVHLWCYGHTHIAYNRIVNGTRIYSNPRGYPRQQTGFNKEEIIKV
jgi:predicted phosphodiesterase